MANSEIIVSKVAIFNAMEKKGISSIKELAKQIGVHRNTINPYLSGERALPEALENLLLYLEIPPAEAFKKKENAILEPAKEISSLLSELYSFGYEKAFVLFGSRARNKAKKYSDFDLGVYQPGDLPFKEFSLMLDVVADWNEKNTTEVQLTNLNFADQVFLHKILEDLIFVGGNYHSYIQLQKKIGVTIYGS